MTPESNRDEIRRAQFERRFGTIGSNVRESWFTLYLQLRDSGDSHSAAVETVVAEMAMDRSNGKAAR
jgi:hypothetical protein